jgi:cold shock CspA family protein
MFNGQFGFINTLLEDIYFHSSGIKTKERIFVGDIVSFCIEKSPVKKDKFQAIKINLIEKKELQKSNKILIGFIDWYDEDRGFGVIKGFENEYFFLKRSIKGIKYYLSNDDVCVFTSIPSPKKNDKFNAIAIYSITHTEYDNQIKDKISNAFQFLVLIDNDNLFNFIKKIFLRIPTEIYRVYDKLPLCGMIK